MNLYTLKNKKGFTIIEVVLVLAVAGLIFLMVFLALPALQRAQRDAQRKQDLFIIKDAIERWMLNNRVSLTHSDAARSKFYMSMSLEGRGLKDEETYFDKPLLTPMGGRYDISIGTLRSFTPTTNCNNGKVCYNYSYVKKYVGERLEFVDLRLGTKCAEEGMVEILGEKDKPYALTMALEGGGFLCLDS